MKRETLKERGRMALIAAIGLGGFAIWFWGALDSPVLSPTRATEKAYLAKELQQSHTSDAAEERALAEAYWDRNPDVAKDAYYGRHGKLGLAGARAHYERYGKREGRKWGLNPSPR